MLLCESDKQEHSFMSASSTDKGLLTPENCAVVFIDHQPQIFFGGAHIDQQDLLNNHMVLAKAAKIIGVQVIFSAVESKRLGGIIMQQVLDLFPDRKPIDRSSMNARDSTEHSAPVKQEGR